MKNAKDKIKKQKTKQKQNHKTKKTTQKQVVLTGTKNFKLNPLSHLLFHFQMFLKVQMYKSILCCICNEILVEQKNNPNY